MSLPYTCSLPSQRGIVEAAAQLTVEDPAYGETAANVELDAIYRETEYKFSMAMTRAQGLLSLDFIALVRRNKRSLDGMIRDNRDSLLSLYVAFSNKPCHPPSNLPCSLALRSLRCTYLLKDGKGIYERPQYLWLRTALFIHGDDLASARRTYDMISTLKFMPGSPILFNSGTKNSQLSSCFLVTAGSRLEEIFDVLAKTANISQGGGGIGMGLGSIPCQGLVLA